MSKSINKCPHGNKMIVIVKNTLYDNIEFCSECNQIYLKNKNEETIKSISFYKEKEKSESINLLLLYQNMREKDCNFMSKYENFNINDRKGMISFITKLVNKYKVSEDSFNLTVLFLDIILSQIPKNYLELDLLAIGSFFLAGNF